MYQSCKELWIQGNNESISVCDMSDDHLNNAINLIHHMARKGYVITEKFNNIHLQQVTYSPAAAVNHQYSCLRQEQNYRIDQQKRKEEKQKYETYVLYACTGIGGFVCGILVMSFI